MDENKHEEPDIKIKRIYEPVDKDDGFRVPVGRLWPRGLKKSEAEWIFG